MAVALICVIPLLLTVVSAVVLGSSGPVHLPLTRRRTVNPDLDHWAHAAQRLGRKYGSTALQKRQNSSGVPLINLEGDSSYLCDITVGTPPQTIAVTLDTGSADLWVATVGCTTCSSGSPLFDPARSTSFQTTSTSIDIQYGSGDVIGPLSSDTVTMGGYTVPSQAFVTAARVTASLVGAPFPGFMGLGFQPLAETRAVPFWQTLLNDQRFSLPLFSLYITRYGNDSAATALEPGGILTLGGTNSSLYSGDIEYNNFPANAIPSYWLQTLTAITVNGMQISIDPSGTLSIIDSGTTLIGGTSSGVRSIYAAVPGSQALTGLNSGFYAIPCTTVMEVSLSFGGKLWPISNDDMILQTGSPSLCVGAIIDLTSVLGTGTAGAPQWIIGDTFLKNVYTVFRATPPSVGFAQLSSSPGSPASSSSAFNPGISPTFSSSPQSTNTSASGTLSTKNRISVVAVVVILTSLVAGCLALV